MGLILNSGVTGKEFVMTDGQIFNYYSLTENNLILGWIFNETPVPFDITWMLNDYISYGATKRYSIFKTGSVTIEVEFLRYSDGNTYVRIVGNGTLSITNFQTSNPPSSLRICFLVCSTATPDNPTDYVAIYANLYDFKKVQMSVETLPTSYGGIDGLCGTTLPDTSSAVSFELQSFDQSLLDYTTLYRSNYYSITGVTPKITYNNRINSRDYNIKSIDGTAPEPYVPPTPPAPDDPNDEGEPSDEDGGDGDHDPQFDPIPIPNKPTQGASTAGFLTMYKLSQGHMQQFGEDMFASNVWEAIKLFFSNPIDFLVGIMLLPFEPAGGSSYKPKFGTISFARAYPTVANQYHDVDCGSIQITKYWGSFLDYAPYTKIQIWLPYIGYRDLDVDEIMGNTISVKYRCDCVTGDCVAFIYVGVVGEETGPKIPRVLAQFYGNCGVQIPFGSVTYDQAVMAGIEMLGTAANWGLSGGSAILDSESFAAYNVNAVNASKPEVQKGGGAGSTVGYMSIQKPYIIRKIARQNLPADYIKFKGYPSNISGKLADFGGFAKVDDIQLNDIPAMETEREEIISLLRGGVLL